MEEDADAPAAEEEADDGADDFFLAVADDGDMTLYTSALGWPLAHS